jgi:purine-binding chemotaxis protein CheW
MQFATFRVEKHLFGIDVREVQEVLKNSSMTPVPLAAEAVRGLLHIRGQIIPALDLRPLLDFPHRVTPSEMNVVVKRQDELVSFLVDEICDVLDVSDDVAEPIPARIPSRIRRALQAVYKLPKELLLVLDPEALASARN